METSIFNYNLEKFNFTNIILDYLGVDDLSTLEVSLKDKFYASENSLYKNMEHSPCYQQLYRCLNSEAGNRFYDAYRRFILEVIRPQYNEPILYQQKPTHRILFLNTPGVSRFHRDRDYGHHLSEINYFVPQTNAYQTNTVWIESKEGLEDYTPLEVEPGQFVRFNGASLKHGAKLNETGKSRVSFDFRVIPVSKSPEKITNTSNWNGKGKSNQLFKNAHGFVLCH